MHGVKGGGCLAPPPMVREAPALPMRRLPALVALGLLAVSAVACSDDGSGTSATTVAPSTESTPVDGTDDTTPTSTPVPSLVDVMLAPEDLPGFAAAADVDDTITTFCAGEDATAGLQASEREVRGFQQDGGGASVIQLAFRFRDDGAARFVAQAEASLGRCSSVPDGTGLAFEYEPVSDGLAETLDGATDVVASRYGVSVGSGNLTVNLAVSHRGDVGLLVAVLGLDMPRSELDALAATAFDTVASRLP